MKKPIGFSLIELMIAVAVVAIIAAIAYPGYQGQIRKTRRSEGQTSLLDALNRQERFYTTNNTYTTSLSAAGIPAGTADGHYLLTVRVCPAATCGSAGPNPPLTNCIEVFAAAQGNQSIDGDLTVDSRNAKCPAAKW